MSALFDTLVDDFATSYDTVVNPAVWKPNPVVYTSGGSLYLRNTYIATASMAINPTSGTGFAADAHIVEPDATVNQFSFFIWGSAAVTDRPLVLFATNTATGGGPPELRMEYYDAVSGLSSGGLPSGTGPTGFLAITYDPVNHAYLRITQDTSYSNEVRFYTSPDGSTWTLRYTTPALPRFLDGQIYLQGVAPQPAAPVQVLSASTSTGYSADFSVPLTEAAFILGPRIAVESGAAHLNGASPTPAVLTTVATYSLIDSSVYLQVDAADVTNTEIFVRDTATGAVMDLNMGTPGTVFWRTATGGATGSVDFTFDAAATRYLRFRCDADGTGHFDTSPDATSWATMFTTSAPMQLNNATLEISSTQAVINGVNVIGPAVAPLAFWDPGRDIPLPVDAFNWGTVPRRSSADLSFRIKNILDTYTVSGITVAVTGTGAPGSNAIENLHLLSADGGRHFTATAAIADLAPGQVSTPLILRRVLPSDAAAGPATFTVQASYTTVAA